MDTVLSFLFRLNTGHIGTHSERERERPENQIQFPAETLWLHAVNIRKEERVDQLILAIGPIKDKLQEQFPDNDAVIVTMKTGSLPLA